MTRYHVDSEAVAATSAAVRATIARLQSESGLLHSQLTELQSSWSGAAATAFQSLAADWRATQQRVEENANAITLALAQAGRQYAEIELQNARLFGR